MRTTINDWWLAVIVIAAILFGFFGARSLQSERDAWERYRDARHCQVVRTEDPPAGISTTPGDQLWQCDGGELILRHAN